MLAAAVRGEWKDTADRDGTPPGSHAAWHTASAENQVHLEPMACSSSQVAERAGPRVRGARGVAAARWRVETCTGGGWRPGETQPSCPHLGLDLVFRSNTVLDQSRSSTAAHLSTALDPWPTTEGRDVWWRVERQALKARTALVQMG